MVVEFIKAAFVFIVLSIGIPSVLLCTPIGKRFFHSVGTETLKGWHKRATKLKWVFGGVLLLSFLAVSVVGGMLKRLDAFLVVSAFIGLISLLSRRFFANLITVVSAELDSRRTTASAFGSDV